MSVSASYSVTNPSRNLSMMALVCGFLSFFLGFIVAIPGIVIGHVARSQIKDNPYRFGGDRLALMGLTMCYLAGLLSTFTVAYIVLHPEVLQLVGEYLGYSLFLSE